MALIATAHYANHYIIGSYHFGGLRKNTRNGKNYLTHFSYFQVLESSMAAVDKQVWANVAKLEDDDCVKRFLCEVATENFEAPDYQPLVQSIIAGDNVRAFL